MIRSLPHCPGRAGFWCLEVSKERLDVLWAGHRIGIGHRLGMGRFLWGSKLSEAQGKGLRGTGPTELPLRGAHGLQHPDGQRGLQHGHAHVGETQSSWKRGKKEEKALV